MPPELEKRLYYQGIELFNEGEYFEAHEAWEEIWHMAAGPRHAFYQGMIQCAVALEHYRRGNPRGVRSLYDSYRPKFKDLPGVFMGLEVPQFLAAMEASLRPALVAGVVAPVVLDTATVPRIVLMYDPFENGEAQRLRRG